MGKTASSQVAFRKRKSPRRCIRFNPERRYPTTHPHVSESPGELQIALSVNPLSLQRESEQALEQAAEFLWGLLRRQRA